MKVYMPISQSIWNDQKYPHLTGEAQLAWFFLFTHPRHTQIGIFKAALAGLYEEINVNGWWTQAQFVSAISLLEQEELVAIDRKNLLIAFPKFYSSGNTQNFPRNSNQLIFALRQFSGLPPCELLNQCLESFFLVVKQQHKRFGKQFLEQFESCSSNSSANSQPNCPCLCIVFLNSLLRLLDGKVPEVEQREHPWPKDLKLTDALIAVGKGFKINPHAEFQKAKDWCLANDRRYSDYEAFLRNWFRRAAEGRKK